VISFIETKLFTRLVGEYLTDEQYSQLQHALAVEPELGAVIPGSGGVRKVRWGSSGRGKRGGVRVIYYVKTGHGQIWMLTIYAKSVKETIPADVLRHITEEIDD
jgi:mRNA-degrading endonuclease RelE of RelBE toxin-antitoxin system